MHAIRLARGHTGRDVIIKIDGCYHGAARQCLGEGWIGGRDVRTARLTGDSSRGGRASALQ